MNHIRIHSEKIIHKDTIQKAERCGNYTNITLMDGNILQLWDEHKIIWQDIDNACFYKKEE